MKLLYGESDSGNLKEAVRNLSNPKLLILYSNEKQFEKHVSELEEIFPNVNSIGCVAMSYSKKVCTNGVCVVALCDIEVRVNVLEQVDIVPVKNIKKFEIDFESIRSSSKDTVVFDLCSGNDACVLTILNSIINKKNVPLVGGTAMSKQVSCNGKIYDNADVYAIIKSPGKTIKVYKENIYEKISDNTYVCSNSKKEDYYVGKFSGKPSLKVYKEDLNINDSQLKRATFEHPLGKVVDDDLFIISIKEVKGDGLICYRQINDSDVITIMGLGDYKKIINDTIDKIKDDFRSISAVLSVNCIIRYQLFTEEGYTDEYLKNMQKLSTNHVGFIGGGEHFNKSFINQSMACIVFE